MSLIKNPYLTLFIRKVKKYISKRLFPVSVGNLIKKISFYLICICCWWTFMLLVFTSTTLTPNQPWIMSAICFFWWTLWSMATLSQWLLQLRFLTPGLLTVLSKHRAISYDNFGDNMKMQLWVAWTWRIFCLAAKNFKYIFKSLLSQYLGWIMTTLEPCKCYVYWWYLLCGN